MATALTPRAAAVDGGWPTGTMRAAVLTAEHRAEEATLPVPAPAAGEALIAPLLVGLCGTDLELLHGTATYVRDGRAPYPHVFGHEWVGRVVALPPQDADAPSAGRPVVGDRVVGHTMISCGSCRACHRGRRNECGDLREVGLYGQQGAAAQYLRMPTRALTVVPDEVGDAQAVLVEPTVTVLEGLARTGRSAGDRALVLGTGTIGLLAVQLVARLTGAVDVVGVAENGLRTAAAFGARRLFRPGQAPGGHYDLVVEASGAPEAFHDAVRAAAVGGDIAVVGVAGHLVDGVDVGDLTLRGITVHGVRHGLDHYDRALRLFAEGALTADGMIARRVPLRRVPDAFRLLQDGDRAAPKVTLDLTAA
ncbi:zinc-binding dehydrogenase [Streptomyces sp. PT12]|uniref:zinc-dependent alcohol dehydrogenase n=1 Tax=Streptomyces sp. PT12 TaxID=1510197 RepID=UPI000DE41E97|nr:alcohol dehydrogenase catalytic domain-containing protein [Streptomyces sp. PT12]RBM06239.1 zinc-binding alcohol dehydrogenase [Streptomyces sp. PT12]